MATLSKIKFPGFPPNPISGGKDLESLDAHIRQKVRYAEPKYNGWRGLIHRKTGVIYNRHGSILSIDKKRIEPALKLIMEASDPAKEVPPPVWLDCEILLNRHGIAVGTVIIFDGLWENWREGNYMNRKYALAHRWSPHRTRRLTTFDHPVMISAPMAKFTPGLRDILVDGDEVYAFGDPIPINPKIKFLLAKMEETNRVLKGPVYEGIVIKNEQSEYKLFPREGKFPAWMKIRFDQ